MMSERRKVPEGYKIKELEVIPDEWDILQIDQLAIINKENKDPTKTPEESFCYIDIDSVENGTGLIKNPKRLFGREAPSRARRVIHKDEVIMSTVRPYHKAFALISQTYDNQICSTGFAVLSCKKNIDPEYLLQSLFSDKTIDQCVSMMAGGQYPALNITQVSKIKIIVPSLQEQQNIASILFKVDKQIEQTKQIIEKIRLLRKGLMQKIFVLGTENRQVKEIDVKYSLKKWNIPENWTAKLFNEITFQITDGTHFTPTYTDEGVPFLRVTDIQSDSVDWNSVKYILQEEHKELIKRCKPEKGNILLSKNGTIGIPKIIDWDKEFSIFVSLCLIKVNTSIVDVNYLYHLLRSDIIRNQYALRAKTGTVTNLHLEEIRELTIPIPPREEQIKISRIMDSFDNELKYENTYLTKLQELKKGLMQDLLTGKVRVCA